MSKLFLPEPLREDSKEPMPHPAEATPTPAEAAPPGDGSTPEPTLGTEGEARAVEGMSPAEAAKAAAAEGPKTGSVGLTGHVFELPNVSDPRAVGLRMVHHLRPAIVALSSLPAGLNDEAVCERVVERFKSHVPMHRTMLIVLTHDSFLEPDR